MTSFEYHMTRPNAYNLCKFGIHVHEVNGFSVSISGKHALSEMVEERTLDMHICVCMENMLIM